MRLSVSMGKKRFVLILFFLLLVYMRSFFVPEEFPPLVLDKTELLHVVEEIPRDKEAAGKLAEDVIFQNYNISRKNFEHYFSLNRFNKTQFRWMLYYDLRKNQSLAVYLVKKLSEEEAFAIADGFVINGVGKEYFTKHFKRNGLRNDTAYYSYLFSPYNPIEMRVKLDYERNIVGHFVLLIPQEIKLGPADAKKIASAFFPEPISATLIFDGSRIAWRCIWQHTATEEDYARQRVYGADVDATTGGILRTFKYVKPAPTSPPPMVAIQKSQVDALVQKLSAFHKLKDGAVINLRISQSFSEKFHIIKSFGKLIAKDGLSEEPDITIWIDRGTFLKALESSDAWSCFIQESKSGHISITEEKSLLVLAQKGYVALYEELKK